MAYFGSLQILFGFNFPRGVLTMAETLVVMRRFKAYLLLAETQSVATTKSSDTATTVEKVTPMTVG